MHSSPGASQVAWPDVRRVGPNPGGEFREISNFWRLLPVIGQFILLGLSFLLLAIWIAAFLSPSKSVVIMINSGNEALPELFLIIAIVPVLIASVTIVVKRALSPPRLH